MNTPTKCCSRCKQKFPATLEYFHSDKSKQDGLRKRCKNCTLESNNNYRRRNPEKIKTIKTQYNNSHQDEIREYKKNWYKSNRIRLSIKRQIWLQNNPTYNRDYHKRNKEKIHQRHRLWQRNNQRVVNIIRARWVARKQSFPDTLTDYDWQYCLNYFNGCCAICGRPRGLWHTLAMDHWIPLSSPDCPGTIPTNIAPLCHGIDGCNNSKHNKPPEQWLIAKFGEKKAKKILKRIHDYFDSLK